MKKILFSGSAIAALIFTGCMNATNLSPQEIKNKHLTPRDVINSNKNAYKIFDDSEKATLFATMGTQAVNKVNIAGVERATEDLSNYCEAIGGKWKYGKRFINLAKKFGTTNPLLYFKVLKNQNTNVSGIGKCEAPEGKGFHLYELGLYDVKIRNIAMNLGGGVVYKWHRYFKIDYDTPNSPKIDYVLNSYKPFLEKNYKNKDVNKIIQDYDRIRNRGIDNYFLITTYPICKYLGGTEYIATDAGTNMKKMTMKDYLFKMYDEELREYGQDNNLSTETYGELIMFPVSKKGYIWCENKQNPDKQFMFIWNAENGYFNAIKGIDYKLINNLQTEDSNNNQPNLSQKTSEKNKISNALNILSKPSVKFDDKNVLNIAKAVMLNKKDLSVNTAWIKYKGFYISNIDSKTKIVVERIYNNDKYFYNFDVVNNQLKFTGKTLQGITQAEKNRFNFEEAKKECKLNGFYLQIVNGLKLYCKYDNGMYKFFIFDKNDNVLEILD